MGNWHAAIGTDGWKPVVWGIGDGEQAALDDANWQRMARPWTTCT